MSALSILLDFAAAGHTTPTQQPSQEHLPNIPEEVAGGGGLERCDSDVSEDEFFDAASTEHPENGAASAGDVASTPGLRDPMSALRTPNVQPNAFAEAFGVTGALQEIARLEAEQPRIYDPLFKEAYAKINCSTFSTDTCGPTRGPNLASPLVGTYGSGSETTLKWRLPRRYRSFST